MLFSIKCLLFFTTFKFTCQFDNVKDLLSRLLYCYGALKNNSTVLYLSELWWDTMKKWKSFLGKTKAMLRAVVLLSVRWKRLFLWNQGPCSIWFMLICIIISLRFIHLFLALHLFFSQVYFHEAYIFSSPFICQFLPPQSFPCRFIQEYKWNPLPLLTCIKHRHSSWDLQKYSL